MDRQNQSTPFTVILLVILIAYITAAVHPGRSAEATQWLSVAGGWMVPTTIALLFVVPQLRWDSPTRLGRALAAASGIMAIVVLMLTSFALAATFISW